MRNISSAFSRALLNDKRDYKNRLVVTLTNGFEFTVDNARIWDDGVKLQDAVSADNVFQIGAAIINQATFVLNNIYGDYDEYSFDGAKVVAYIGLTDLDDGTSEEIKLGTFEVDETQYNGSLITLTCLDYMSRFDRAYTFDRSGDQSITYPNTLEQIVLNACHNCNVSLDSLSLNFPHKDYIVTDKPSGENTTYRQVISWAAQIACCYARCNVDGKLEIKWYETDEFDNISSWIDGGVFDGLDVGWLEDYLNTEEGMTTISSTAADDQWFRIDNSIEFPFNGYVPNYIYIDSDSCFAFADTQPSNHGHNSLKDVNICTRDGQSISIKYQEISANGKNTIKVRFKGYTRYGESNRTAEYALEYEIFFVENREIIINFITLPTNTSYRGTSSIIENNVSKSITPTTSSILAYYQDKNNNWEGGSADGAYFTGDTADGGTFSPWNTGDVHDGGTFRDRNTIHFITSSYSSNISTDNVVVTGVKVIKKIKEEGQSDSFIEYTSGTTGYVVVIENNDFIDGTHGQDIANWIGLKVNGLSFRRASLTHPNDPSIEAGDVALYFDLNGNVYPMLVSSTTFSPGNSQQTVSSAETPAKNSAQRFTETTRNYVEVRKQLKQQRDSIEEDIAESIAQASGLFSTEEVDPGGGTKIYYHDKAELGDSDIVMLFTTTGFTLTSNYQDPNPTWYGMTVDGQMIASILNTTGINADWINTGHLSFTYCQGGMVRLGGTSNNNGVLEIYDSSGTRVGRWDNTGLYIGNIASNLSDPNTSIDTDGAISTNSLVADDYVYVDGNTRSYLNIPMGNTSCFTRVSNTGFMVRDKYGNDVYITTNDYNDQGLRIRPTNYSYSQEGTNIDGTDLTIYGSSLNDSWLYMNKGTIALSKTFGTSTDAAFAAYTDGYGSTHSGSGAYVRGTFSVNGNKNRVVETDNYSRRALSCYETPTAMFGDIGEGVIGDDGLCYVSVDPIFLETISKDCAYQVFLQKYGEGECYVSERKSAYFVVVGEPNLSFAWEIKAKQIDFDQERLPIREQYRKNETIDYASEAIKHIRSIADERSL